ncbi:MAG: CHAT domain-containing protein, partial [Cyanobacteria bacterium J06576_12]
NTRLSQQLYQQIIAPFKATLTHSEIKTLIFMNDGILRNIPMAALYDGQAYLVEQYALAIAPSLQKSKSDRDTALPSRALILGLSQDSVVEGQRFSPLPAVEREVQEVLSIFPKGDLLLNEAFTKNNLQQNLSDRLYPVLHIATHGRFESTPGKTVLITGDVETNTTENKLLRLGELDSLVRAGVRTGSANARDRSGLLDLIVLSACQTATGDERSSLGLAGVTIRAGAETALASLWSVDDAATADLITYFYQNWNSGLSKSEALRQAQITVMKDVRYPDHPAYWAAFLLVGDWQ